jgi:hypothetical protein
MAAQCPDMNLYSDEPFGKSRLWHGRVAMIPHAADHPAHMGLPIAAAG